MEAKARKRQQSTDKSAAKAGARSGDAPEANGTGATEETETQPASDAQGPYRASADTTERLRVVGEG